MIKFTGLVIVGALAGAAIGCGLAYWAATQWSSFSSRWLNAAGFLSPVGGILGAWLASPKEAWPPGWPRKLVVMGVGAACGGLSSYVAFALVSLTWNPRPDLGLVAALMDPSAIPELSSSRGSGPGISQGAVFHLVVGALIGGLLPPLWLQKTGPKPK